MTPYDFKNIWTVDDETLTPLTLSKLSRFNLLNTTVEFLSEAGLPNYASPHLSFACNTDNNIYGIYKLTEQSDYLDLEYEKYIAIGYCRDGDIIAIDTNDNDQIKQLDHEDLFSEKFFNSSIWTLAQFLVVYRDFEKGFKSFYFTDEQFSILRERMFAIDSKAMSTEGFWKDELEILISLRQDAINKLLT